LKYSIQNAFGEVFGIFPVPITDKSAETLEDELAIELAKILGINRVATTLDGNEKRIVIDINPFLGAKEQLGIVIVHQTMGRLAVPKPEYILPVNGSKHSSNLAKNII
jgi:hypothetical protein